jgi:hypothetical protein
MRERASKREEKKVMIVTKRLKTERGERESTIRTERKRQRERSDRGRGKGGREAETKKLRATLLLIDITVSFWATNKSIERLIVHIQHLCVGEWERDGERERENAR